MTMLRADRKIHPIPLENRKMPARTVRIESELRASVFP